MSEPIVALLARLDNARVGKDVYIKRKQDLMNDVITEEIKQKLKDIDEELAPDFERFDEIIKGLEVEIKESCVEHGSSVKGEHLLVSFVKGRVSWDSKGLQGYAVAHPEILQFQKTGNPYASIKNKK